MRALPGGPSLLLTLCYIIIHVWGKKACPVPKAPVEAADQSGSSYQCVQAGETAWQRLGVKFFWGGILAPQEMHYCMRTQTAPLC